MIPQTGVVAYFTFAAKFSALNGIYRVLSISSYSAAQSSGTDFVATTYTAAGLSKTDWQNDYTAYTGGDVYFLQQVTGSNPVTYPIPLAMLDGEPNYEVEKYANLVITFQLGAWSDPNEINWLIGRLNQDAAAATGLTVSGYLYEDDLNPIWMKMADYQALASSRAAAATQLQPYPVQIQNMGTEIQQLKNIITAYEQTLASVLATANKG